jgi:hypothetical protein
LARFEQTLQNIDPLVCLPYWDWSRTSQDYTKHVVFTSNYMGSPLNGCISDGPFMDWNVYQTTTTCVSREFLANTLPASMFIVGLMQGSPNYTNFRTRYETQLHSLPHVSIGGAMAQMYSSGDPIFCTLLILFMEFKRSIGALLYE